MIQIFIKKRTTKFVGRTLILPTLDDYSKVTSFGRKQFTKFQRTSLGF
jgi:hypothetical protein